ncbi:MAG: translation initiation factor IF-2 [Eubacteriales bacterium]|nr:translation initiation factor IF-2 [Eubacteriales bacterium]MDD4389805.1 translation initiation factor IF-2 [Eubacteriales bacterium]
MTIKVYELAKELNVSSQALLDRANSMGIDAKDEKSIIADMDAVAVRNTVNRGRAGTETKIVKVANKKTTESDNEPKIVVKAAAIKTSAKKEPQQRGESRGQQKHQQTQRPPVGKPVAPKELDARVKPPVGKPIISKDLEQRTRENEKRKPETEERKQHNTTRSYDKRSTPERKSEPGSHRPHQDRPHQDRPHQDRPHQDRPQQDRSARPPRGDNAQGYERKTSGERSPGKPAAGGRPARPGNDGRDRNQSNTGNQRPYNKGAAGAAGNRPSRPDKPDMGVPGGKSNVKKGDKKKTTKDKEKNKFAKIETPRGKKDPVRTQRSLEKAPKPKKHIKKEKPVQEQNIIIEELPAGTVVVTVPITVAGFCEQLQISTSTVIMKLMKLGIMANINQSLDEDTVVILAEEMGVPVVIGDVEGKALEEGLETFEDKEEDLKSRPPIITVMGHVDHGKTSLLDAIRKTHVTERESGGITQHIGASEVMINGHKIVFLDTPGHEAFTAMRARGAHVTDMAVLVVAADDSVKPQTIESISHAKAAGVPIIVAINKMDKPSANPDRVMQDLTEHGILVEAWGGDTIAVPVSAKSGEGIVNLLEMILLQAEMLELKANPNRLAIGTVIEARLDKSKGPVATLLVLNGTLQSGMSIVAGTSSGKIRLMTNFRGEKIKKAGPATAVEILGLTDVPEAGDEFNAVKEDRIARDIAENRKSKLREEVLARNSSTTLEALFSQIQEGEIKELNLIIKGDVQGSVGAIVSSLEKLRNENVRVKILHTGVGTVTESDIMLAGTSGAVIIGFNVRPSVVVANMAEHEGIEIRTYRVIYDIINDVEASMKGMLDPEYKEVVLGTVEIRETFKVPGIGIIGGAYVTNGKAVRNAEVRLVRDGIVIHEGKISSLKRFKDDAKEVNQGYECGIGIENYNDIKVGDIIECFEMQEIKRD